MILEYRLGIELKVLALAKTAGFSLSLFSSHLMSHWHNIFLQFCPKVLNIHAVMQRGLLLAY